MTRSRHDQRWVDDVRQEYLDARSRSTKEAKEVIDRYAQITGKDRSTIFRRINAGICNRTKNDEVQARQKQIETAAMEVWNLQRERSTDDAEYSTRSAYEVLRAQNKIASDITLDAIYHALQRLNLKNRAIPVAKRFERRHALSLLQVDYSVSRYFGNHGNGNVVVKKASVPYYSKEKQDDNRLWFCVAVDDATRVVYAEYVLTRGENVAMVHGFLLNAFAKKQRTIEATGEIITDKLYQGIPREIYWDRGPANRAASTLQGLTEMGIEVTTGNNAFDGAGNDTGRSNKKAHGKVENAVGKVKKIFEQRVAGMHKIGTVVHLDTLNALLHEWLKCEDNVREHPTRAGIRWDLFEPELFHARFPDDDALCNFGQGFKRVVRNRLINVGRGRYAVAPLWANDGAQVVIVKEHDLFYIMHEGARELLTMQNEEVQSAAVELETDVLSDMALRERLDEELKSLSDGDLSIRDVRATHGDDLKYFFEKARTVEEVKNTARIICGEIRKPATNIIYAKPI